MTEPRSFEGGSDETIDLRKKLRWKMPSGEETERALAAAERLLAEARAESRHLRDRSFNFASLAVVVFLSISATVYAFFDWALAPLALLVVLGMLAVLIMTLLKYLRTRSLLREETTLEIACEIASIVGDSMHEVAKREHWSELRIQSVRLRLSAFPMLPGKRRHW